jgi:hypothetical protein
VDEPMMSSNNSEKTTKSNDLGIRGESLMIINALNLSVAFSNKSSLIALSGVVRRVFDFVDPFAIDRFMTYR